MTDRPILWPGESMTPAFAAWVLDYYRPDVDRLAAQIVDQLIAQG